MFDAVQMPEQLSARIHQDRSKGHALHPYSSSSDLIISLQLILCRCDTCEGNPERGTAFQSKH